MLTILRPSLGFLLIALSPLCRPPVLFAAENKADPAEERANFVRNQYTKFEHRIPMRDDARLFTAVYVPTDASPARTYPFLLVRTPFSVAPYGLDRFKTILGPTAEYE